jgi:hypothetical protein
MPLPNYLIGICNQTLLDTFAAIRQSKTNLGRFAQGSSKTPKRIAAACSRGLTDCVVESRMAVDPPMIKLPVVASR